MIERQCQVVNARNYLLKPLHPTPHLLQCVLYICRLHGEIGSGLSGGIVARRAQLLLCYPIHSALIFLSGQPLPGISLKLLSIDMHALVNLSLELLARPFLLEVLLGRTQNGL
ncbi:hypothetical protein CDL12_24136 [Handroanthus impetiginosus]|uniref:Uncharacterized protein n=1 Tax=Handroanthus impetiginosus TaxID=429701 RepID=A0A2G9GDH8_9LAMI|nr:hypothetical protein CDL12_24136 [Handroanthus impetiginosus]